MLTRDERSTTVLISFYHLLAKRCVYRIQSKIRTCNLITKTFEVLQNTTSLSPALRRKGNVHAMRQAKNNSHIMTLKENLWNKYLKKKTGNSDIKKSEVFSILRFIYLILKVNIHIVEQHWMVPRISTQPSIAFNNT